MGNFHYRAKDGEGRTLEGVVEAPNQQAAEQVLREKKLLIISILEERKKVYLKLSMNILSRVKARDLVLFSRQLSVMESANVPLVRALRILTHQTDSVHFKVVISQIADDVEGGARLSRALARHPKVFSSYFIHMLTSGETTGKLDEVLNVLADQLEKDYDLRSRLRGSMIYPGFIFSTLIVIGTVMMIFVVPKFSEILLQGGQALPLPTRILIGISNFLNQQWWLLLILIIGLIGGLVLFRRTEMGKRTWDELKLRLPVFGKIFQRIYLTRLTQSLSGLIQSGVPLTQALRITAEIVGNEAYRSVTLKTVKEVEVGNSIANLYAKDRNTPPMVAHMMRVGEETGRLDFVLERLSKFYNREVENAVKNLMTLLEPIIFLILGAGAAVLVVGILLPIYQMSLTN